MVPLILGNPHLGFTEGLWKDGFGFGFCWVGPLLGFGFRFQGSEFSVQGLGLWRLGRFPKKGSLISQHWGF